MSANLKIATGKAMCQLCKQTIAKGLNSIYFHGGGQIHFDTSICAKKLLLIKLKEAK